MLGKKKKKKFKGRHRPKAAGYVLKQRLIYYETHPSEVQFFKQTNNRHASRLCTLRGRNRAAYKIIKRKIAKNSPSLNFQRSLGDDLVVTTSNCESCLCSQLSEISSESCLCSQLNEVFYLCGANVVQVDHSTLCEFRTS